MASEHKILKMVWACATCCISAGADELVQLVAIAQRRGHRRRPPSFTRQLRVANPLPAYGAPSHASAQVRGTPRTPVALAVEVLEAGLEPGSEGTAGDVLVSHEEPDQQLDAA